MLYNYYRKHTLFVHINLKIHIKTVLLKSLKIHNLIYEKLQAIIMNFVS
jgi:hypothetical protein